MLSLKTGTYLGEVLDITQAGGVLAGTTSYWEGDATGVMHYHENPQLSFVPSGGGVERREHSQFERLPGQVMFFHSGESHQCINKLFPARNFNLEIEPAFLRGGAVTESAIGTAVSHNPNLKFVMLRVYKELLAGDAFTGASVRMLLLGVSAPTLPPTRGAPAPSGSTRCKPSSTTGGTSTSPWKTCPPSPAFTRSRSRNVSRGTSPARWANTCGS